MYTVVGNKLLNIYVVVAPSVSADKLLGDPVILYPVTGNPPLEVGADHEILKLTVFVSNPLDSKILGGEGVLGVVILVVAGIDSFVELIAVTLILYVVLYSNGNN